MIFAGKRPSNLGVRDRTLAPCPNSPNCVCSQSTDAVHKIAPLTYTSSPEQALADIKSIIQSLPRTTIINESDDYLYAEFKSALMGFVDDVEFYLDRNDNIIHVRSASRLGQSDLGVNRNRVETIRTKLNEIQQNRR
ncbi:MAG: DUF1499 domain-containing protein [Pelatocladus maniniholoensis HA4357-MV3]|jgi:uncharacterized protein (DUF1499 family)|uniref:DUF1499 domain-containing protein n=1 Tax=Pelatocladus maniniholoensis HA4357-MV3 TaxID=1117104 RepID=A0A9E3LT68_9NOST|nr:DUF1499 domain-containing protein [Pelatocladus maniniholoensis HA4357-MV3]